MEFLGGQERRHNRGRKDEEYVADFYLVSKRVLDQFEYKIFRFHFLLGADWRLCCRRLEMDKGLFFHSVYRIQQKLGRAFRELQPYALFPLDEYFGPVVRDRNLRVPAANLAEMPQRRSMPIRPPVRKAA